MSIRFLRLGASAVALTFGLSIVGVSLVTAGAVESSDGGRMSDRTLYVHDEILPDHVLYPLIMASDRIELEMADEHEQLYVKIQYAERRLGYTKQLLERGNTELALSTLTKSQKYLLSVAHTVLEHQLQGAIRVRIMEEIGFHAKKISELSPEFTDEQVAVINALIAENAVLEKQLAESVHE